MHTNRWEKLVGRPAASITMDREITGRVNGAGSASPPSPLPSEWCSNEDDKLNPRAKRRLA